MAHKRRFGREVVLFLISGGSAAALNLAVGAGVRVAAGVDRHMLSVVAGFTAGTVLSFVMNRELTFRARRDSLSSQTIRFVIVAIANVPVAALLAEVVFRLGVMAFGGRFDQATIAHAAHVAAVGLMSLLNYPAMKFFALRR